MPWVRLDEHALNHAKILALSNGAFRLWIEGLAHCQKHLTDGTISRLDLRAFRYSTKARICELTTSVHGHSPLWDCDDESYHVHDYLQWNDSRQQVQASRRDAQVRMALVRDPELRKAIQARDGNACRYCGQTVNWTDRKGPRGATYDHVIPGGSDDLSNLVVACRGCNSKKGQRTPEQAGMVLSRLNQVQRSRSDLDQSSARSSTHTTTTVVPIDQALQNPRAHETNGKTPDPRRAHPLDERPVLSGDSLARFDALVALYPRKDGRQKALAEWRALDPSPELSAAISAAVEQRLSAGWARDTEPRYLPMLGTFLGEKRWQERYAPAVPASQPSGTAAGERHVPSVEETKRYLAEQAALPRATPEDIAALRRQVEARWKRA